MSKVVIANVRFSFVHVFQPHKFDGDTDKEPRYSAVVLIPKSDTKAVHAVKLAIKEAYDEAKMSKWAGKSPAQWFNPLQDGDTPTADGDERGEAYKGHYFLNAKSRTKPGLVDTNYQPILSTEEFYSGCYGHVSIAFSGFENSGKKGISCFLNNIMKTKDGEPLGAVSATPEEDFAGLAVPSDDDLL